MGKRLPVAEDLEFDICFCEGLIAKCPDFVEALVLLGELYTHQGLYEKGLTIDQQLVRLRPEDPVVFYNLACSYSLLKRMDEAFDAMRTAIALGYDDFSHMGQDQDLENLFRDSRFREYLTDLKNRRTSVQQHGA